MFYAFESSSCFMLFNVVSHVHIGDHIGVQLGNLSTLPLPEWHCGDFSLGHSRSLKQQSEQLVANMDREAEEPAEGDSRSQGKAGYGELWPWLLLGSVQMLSGLQDWGGNFQPVTCRSHAHIFMPLKCLRWESTQNKKGFDPVQAKDIECCYILLCSLTVSTVSV